MNFDKLTMLRERLTDDVNHLGELRQEAYSPSSPIISDMPKSSSFSADGGKPARIVSDISEMEERVLDDKIQIVRELKRLELKIQEIPESRIRVALTAHYLSGMQWDKVHKELNYKGSADALKKCCNRYFRE